MTEQAAAEQTTQETPSNGFAIPQEYASKGWVAEGKIGSYEDLFKAYDNAQSLIGKRPAGIPSNDAPQEEWDKYYASARPESPDKYELSSIEGLPEGFDATSFQNMIREVAHSVGMTPRQADQAWQKVMGLELEAFKSKGEQQAALDKEFGELSTKLFGDQFDTYSKQAQEFIGKSLPPELKVDWENMPNTTMAAFIQVAKHAQSEIDAVKKQFGGEDKLKSGNQNTAKSIDDVRAELVKANSELQKAKVFSPEYKQIEENRNKLRETLSRMVNK